MTDEEFRKQILGDFSTVERTDLLWLLAKEYYERCDAYDARVCTGTGRDGPMPATDEEFRLINANAHAVLRGVKMRAHSAGYSSSELHETMREYIKAGKR